MSIIGQRQAERERERERDCAKRRGSLRGDCQEQDDLDFRISDDENLSCSRKTTIGLPAGKEQEHISSAEPRPIVNRDRLSADPAQQAQTSTTSESSRFLSETEISECTTINESPEETYAIDQFLNLNSPQYFQMHGSYITPTSETSTHRPATPRDSNDKMALPLSLLSPWSPTLDHGYQSSERAAPASHTPKRPSAVSDSRPISPLSSATHSRQHSANNISTPSLASGTCDDKVQTIAMSTRDDHDNSDEGKTALHICAARGSLRMAQLLIDHDIDVDSTDSQGRTALHIAASKGHVLLMKTLLKAGADPDAIDCYGVSPIHAAVNSECEGAIDLLVREGADLNAPIQVGSRRVRKRDV